MYERDLVVTLAVSGCALLAVCVPFLRGLRVAARGAAATRRLPAAELERRLGREAARRGEPVALQMLRVLASTAREREGQGAPWPAEFLVDASRQYVSHDWEAHVARPLAMYANLLPPIGFIGTTGGLFVLFLSMRVASASLELGALALALTSSLFALMGFAVLEGLKIRLYARMLAGIDDAVALYRRPRAPRERASAA